MAEKKPGYQFNIFEETVADKTAAYEKARKKIQAEIDSLEHSVNQYDNGLGDIEDRNELRYLHRQLEQLDEDFKREIAKLNVPQKSK